MLIDEKAFDDVFAKYTESERAIFRPYFEAYENAKTIIKLTWQSSYTAPKGSPTENAGERSNSEWFIGKLKDKSIREIQRLPSAYSHAWKDREDSYYTEDWLVGWIPLPCKLDEPINSIGLTATEEHEFRTQIENANSITEGNKL